MTLPQVTYSMTILSLKTYLNGKMTNRNGPANPVDGVFTKSVQYNNVVK